MARRKKYMPAPTCSVCGRRTVAKGLCSNHYQKHRYDTDAAYRSKKQASSKAYKSDHREDINEAQRNKYHDPKSDYKDQVRAGAKPKEYTADMEYWAEVGAANEVTATQARQLARDMSTRLRAEVDTCEGCGKKPPVTLHVHRLQPPRVAPELALERSNILVVCRTCKTNIERERKGQATI